jgi:uncharacterized protein GlcG (DUF336 family)
MAELTLEIARKILDAALAKGIEKKLKPLVVTVLDARGCVKLTAAQDGTSLLRSEIAHGKAFGALAMGMMTDGTTRMSSAHSSSHASPRVCVWISRNAQSLGRSSNDMLCAGTSSGTAYSTMA